MCDKSEQLITQANEMNDRSIRKTPFIVFLDPHYNIIWMDRSLINLLGKSLSFFAGKYFFDLLPDTEMKTIFKRVKETNKSHLMAFVKTKMPFFYDNLSISFDWCLIPYQNDKGYTTGFFFIVISYS